MIDRGGDEGIGGEDRGEEGGVMGGGPVQSAPFHPLLPLQTFNAQVPNPHSPIL